MSVQSTNIADIPIVNKAYTEIEKVIPSKELWKQATEYINYEKNEIQNKVNHWNSQPLRSGVLKYAGLQYISRDIEADLFP